MNDIQDRQRRIKPGWILLLGLLIYSIFVTSALQRTRNAFTNLQSASAIAASNSESTSESNPATTGEAITQATSIAEDGLWMPIVGARVPQNPMYLPSAPRNYRLGQSQGFDFYSDDAGVSIAYGTPVIASDNATVIRVDTEHTELAREEWDALLAEVGTNGATNEQLDILRGRQIWLETKNGQILRYAHLSGIRTGIEIDQQVYRGQVIGYVGNSGTDNAVKGDAQGARLHFEVWESDDQFFGKGLDIEDVQIRAPRLFVGP